MTQLPTQQWTDGSNVVFSGVVVRASYGPVGMVQDCTAAIQALQAQGRWQINGGIHTAIGDPNPGVPKIFQVWYSSGPSQQGADGGNAALQQQVAALAAEVAALRQGAATVATQVAQFKPPHSLSPPAAAQFNPQRAVVPALAHGLGSVLFSSAWDDVHDVVFRIGQSLHKDRAGAWCAKSLASDPQGKEWVNVSFPSPVFVVSVRVQGRTVPDSHGSFPQHVKKLQLFTSDFITRGQDGGVVWVPVAGPDGNTLLDANNDNVNIATLPVNRAARAVRIVPIVVHQHCSMRFEVDVQLLS
jgi:hypothetical protein